MTTAEDVLSDLVSEQDALDVALRDLSPQQWEQPTASPRWSVADQIAHLAYFDDTAALAIVDPEAFTAHIPELFAHFGDEEAVDAATLGSYRKLSSGELLARWRENRQKLVEAASGLADEDRVLWYGPSMGAKSFLTARLMECWAHGQDAVHAVGRSIAPADRLAHIARLGVNTRGWSYMNRKLEVPDVDVSVTLVAPSGDTWEFGSSDALETVAGRAEDFCLVVTQRRHVDDTGLVVTGDAAREWMLIAQAFAGTPTTGPAPTSVDEDHGDSTPSAQAGSQG